MDFYYYFEGTNVFQWSICVITFCMCIFKSKSKWKPHPLEYAVGALGYHVES